MVESALRAHSSSVRGSRRSLKTPEDSVSKTGKLQPFIKEEVVVGIYKVSIIPFTLKFNFHYCEHNLTCYSLRTSSLAQQKNSLIYF